MKVLILKGDSPRHDYFAHAITEINSIDTKILCHDARNSGRLKKMALKSPSTFIARVTKYSIYSCLKWKKKEADFFGSINLDQTKINSFVSKATVDLIRNWEPDLIVAFGVPIIPNKILDIPRFKAINLHGGISPQYKGGNTIFWPLVEGKPEEAGATLHYMVKKVDSGKIIAKVYPEINSADDELSVSCKTFKHATHEMMKVVEWIRDHQKMIPGEEQKEKGRLYLAKHRTLSKDLQGFRKIKVNLENVNLPFRVERMY